MDLIEHISSKAFLGPEFLTWLWYRIEESDGQFSIPDVGEVELFFGDLLALVPSGGDGQQYTYKGGDPTLSVEARAGLALGKLVAKARLTVVKDERAWTFVLSGAKLDLTGITIPGVLTKEYSERLFERMALIDELDAVITGLFSLFIADRFKKSWKVQTLPRMQRWTESQPFVS